MELKIHFKLTLGLLLSAPLLHAATWENETVQTGVQGAHITIGIDAQRQNHLVYTGSAGTSLNYAKWDGTQWLPETIVSGFESVDDASVAVDINSGNVMVAYAARNAGSTSLYLGRKTPTTAWTTELVSSSQTIREVTLGINFSGSPRIIYTQLTGDEVELRYARYTGTSWVLSTFDRGPDIHSPSMALDSTLNPRVVYTYRDAAGASALKYAQFANAQWQFETIEGGGFVTTTGNLALAAGDAPRVAYRMGASLQRSDLKYAVRLGSNSWQSETLATGVADIAWPHLAIDNAGNPGISYMEPANGGASGALKFARNIGSTWTIDTAADAGAQMSAVRVSGSGQIRIGYQTDQQSVMFARTVSSDTTLPRVSIMSPADGATVSGIVTISGTATDDQSVPFTSIQVDNGAFNGAAGNNNWTYSLNTAQLANGSHTITARCSDANGNLANTSITITVNNQGGPVDTTPPSVSIVALANGAPVTGTISVSGTAADDTQVASVAVQIDNGAFSNAAGSANWSFSLNTANLANGNHTVTARAQDSAGNTASSSVQINVTNSDPSPGPAVWQKEWVEENVQAVRSVLAYDSSRNPAMAYTVVNGADVEMRFALWNGSSWQKELITQGAFDYSSLSLTFDTSGSPILSFVQTSGANSGLSYAKRGASGWTLESIAVPAGTVTSAGLAVGSDNQPRIVFTQNNLDVAQTGQVGYARWTGTEWRLSQIDSGTAVNYQLASIAMDSGRSPGVSYVHYTTGFSTAQLAAALWNGTAWVRQPVSPVQANTLNSISIAYDAGNNPKIAYSFVASGQDHVRLAEKSGTSWSDAEIDSASSLSGASLAFNNSNQAAASYVTAGDLKVATRSGSTWSMETLDSNVLAGASIKRGANLGIAYGISGVSGGVKFAKLAGGTNPPTDTANPSIAILSPQNGASLTGTATVSGTASDDAALSRVEIQIDQQAFQTVSGLNSWSFSLNTRPLSNGTHTLNARATDTSGKTGTASLSFSVQNSTDLPPVEEFHITDLIVTEIGPNHAVVAWNTDREADGEVQYGISAEYGLKVNHADPKTHHELRLENLCPNMPYHFRAVSKDGSGGSATSADMTFRTTKKKIRMLTVSGRKVHWQYDRDDKFAGYVVCRSTRSYPTFDDAENKFEVSDDFLEDASAVPGTRYYYRVYPKGVYGEWTGDPAAVSSVADSSEIFKFNVVWRMVSSSEGETLNLESSQVVIPPHGLPQDMEISIQNPATPDDDLSMLRLKQRGLRLVGKMVDLGPDNLQLNQPASLVLSYDPSHIKGMNPKSLRAAHWNAASQEWEFLDSQVDPSQQTVTAATSHFSRYAILAKAVDIEGFAISQAYSYPNPARNSPTVNILIQADMAEEVSLRIYNDLGQRVHEAGAAAEPSQDGGTLFRCRWDVSGMPSGTYLFVAEAKRQGMESLKKEQRIAIIR